VCVIVDASPGVGLPTAALKSRVRPETVSFKCSSRSGNGAKVTAAGVVDRHSAGQSPRDARTVNVVDVLVKLMAPAGELLAAGKAPTCWRRTDCA